MTALNLENLTLKAPQLLFLLVITTFGVLVLSDAFEDTLIDGCSFNYAFAIIGVLFLGTAVVLYKFETAFDKLYTPS